MQLSLFSVENESKELFRKYLAQFDLAQALHELQLWQRTVDAPENLADKIRTIQMLKEDFENEQHKQILFLANLRQNLENISELDALKEDFRFLWSGLNMALNERLTEDNFDFIFEDLHPAEIFVLEDEYQKAINVIEKYLEHYGEHSFLRQLQGAAYFKLGNKKESLICYTYALFNNPLETRPDFFWPKDLKNKMDYLQNKFPGLIQAKLHLPLTLWEEGKTYIDSENTKFESFLKTRIAQTNEKLTDYNQIFIRFLHLLYLAEVERLRCARRERSQQLKKIQEEMQKVSPDWYIRYENALQKFQMI